MNTLRYGSLLCSVLALISACGSDDSGEGADPVGCEELFVSEIGAACTVGVGACAVLGQYACSPEGDAVVCVAEPGAAGTELCGNGVDDDCVARSTRAST